VPKKGIFSGKIAHLSRISMKNQGVYSARGGFSFALLAIAPVWRGLR
jgi:hypothetical protein